MNLPRARALAERLKKNCILRDLPSDRTKEDKNDKKAKQSEIKVK